MTGLVFAFRASLVLSLTFALGCTSSPEADDEAGVTTSPSGDPTSVDASDESSTTSDDTTSATSTSTSSTDEGPLFVDTAEDGVWGGDPCDSFAQDCPEGEKCVPYSSSGGSWDALKCVPIQGDQAVGEACMYAGPLDSTDDCDATSWCWDADANGNGTCAAFCTGTPDMPMCPPMYSCTISGDGVITICLSDCDPLIQDCGPDEGCYWAGDQFSCVISAGDIPVGEPCGFVNDCAAGLICVDGGTLPSCADLACCTEYCDLGDPLCVLPGTECVPFFPLGEAPAGYEQVGLCVVP